MAPITSAIRRQMTDEGARVTADRDEFLAVCDAVDAIHARRLKALDASTRRVDELCKENAKLHELVADLWHELHAEEGSAQRRMALADRMRELGIEVDE